jgi:hypothetical protein
MLGCKNIAVIFVKYREVPTHTILPNFIDLSVETALYLRFGGGMGQREKEEAYIEEVFCRYSAPVGSSTFAPQKASRSEALLAQR